MKKLVLFNLKSLVVLAIFILLNTSCKTTQKPYYTFINVPYTDYEYETKTRNVEVQKPYLVDEYKLFAPLFPYNKDEIKIAVLPFTDSQNGNIGLSISVDLEYELIKRIEHWSTKNRNEIILSTQKLFKQKEIVGITNQDIEKWYSNNAKPNYEVVDRTELEMMIKEANLTTQNYLAKVRKSISAIDGLIVGHVLKHSSNKLSIIFKVVDVQTSKIIFTEKYSGEYTDVINNSVDAFFYNFKKTGNQIKKYKTQTVKEEYKEKKPITKYKKKRVKRTKEVKEVDWNMIGAGLILTVISILLS